MQEKVLKEFFIKRRINTNGTVSIPRAFRGELNLGPGDTIYFAVPVDQGGAKEKYDAQRGVRKLGN